MIFPHADADNRLASLRFIEVLEKRPMMCTMATVEVATPPSISTHADAGQNSAGAVHCVADSQEEIINMTVDELCGLVVVQARKILTRKSPWMGPHSERRHAGKLPIGDRFYSLSQEEERGPEPFVSVSVVNSKNGQLLEIQHMGATSVVTHNERRVYDSRPSEYLGAHPNHENVLLHKLAEITEEMRQFANSLPENAVRKGEALGNWLTSEGIHDL